MACMCGDICCWSCGPAQGNTRCPICRAWASDGCDHIDGESGDIKPEFRQQADEIARQEALAEEELVRQLDEAEKLAEQYWREQG